MLSLQLFERLPEHPILTVTRAVELLGCTRPAAGKALRVLEDAGVVRELDPDHNRAVVFGDHVDVLGEGTELD